MIKLIRRALGKDDSGDTRPGTPYRLTGGAIIAVGLTILSPGPRDALLAFINKTQALGLSLDAPWWIGIPVIALGALIILLGFVTDRSGSHKGQFVAIRHQSFQPLVGDLPNNILPKRMRSRKINHYECDLSSFLSGGVVDPMGAVRKQERLSNQIAAVRTTDHDAEFGYYGIVHIPLQFLAGCSISTYPKVLLFELNRTNNTWSELQEGLGQNLKPSSTRTVDPITPAGVVVRIEVSYPVAPAEIEKIIPAPYREYVLRIKNPGIDKITHYSQVEALCTQFRSILDEVHNELDKELPIHVFYAGPVSLGFSLGRQISRTIHNRVFVYNYTAQITPAYSWGIDVTRDTPPEEIVVKPQLIQA